MSWDPLFLFFCRENKMGGKNHTITVSVEMIFKLKQEKMYSI